MSASDRFTPATWLVDGPSGSRHVSCKNRPPMIMTVREFDAMDRNDLPAVAAPSFALGLWRIAAADVSSGNRVALLRDGPATFDAMVELIDNAKASIALESYIFRSDD